MSGQNVLKIVTIARVMWRKNDFFKVNMILLCIHIHTIIVSQLWEIHSSQAVGTIFKTSIENWYVANKINYCTKLYVRYESNII